MSRKQAASRLYVLLLGNSCLMSIAAGVDLVLVKNNSVWETYSIVGAIICVCLSLSMRWWIAPQLRRPPWQRLGRRLKRGNRIIFPMRVSLHWHLSYLSLQQHIERPLPVPKPRRSAPQRQEVPVRKRQPIHRHRLRQPPFHIHFTQSSVAFAHDNFKPQHVQSILDDVQHALSRAAHHPPKLLALHMQPNQMNCQFTAGPLLSPGEQRSVAQDLQAKRYSAKWSGVAQLNVSLVFSDALHHNSEADNPIRPVRWLPTLREGRAVVWWPLDQHQHVMFAGAVEAPLTAFVRQLQQLLPDERPELFMYDPDGYLPPLDDIFAEISHDVDALAKARQFQLAHRYAVTRDDTISQEPGPICIVVAPDETVWPELQPLLAPDSGVQVMLVCAHRPPIAPLRAACHHLYVIETPDLRRPALPDAFRPAGIPPARYGQVLAWSPGGQTVWRGSPLAK